MLYNREKAIDIMNSWGAEKVPFLFIIDFEMEAIRLLPLKEKLPDNIIFNFNNNTKTQVSQRKEELVLYKYPVSFGVYKKKYDEVINQIQLGNSFLINLTLQTPIESNFTLSEIYEYCRAKYKILIDGEFVCFSPETFVTIKSGIISTFPMKGTTRVESVDSEKALLTNKKEIAEHHTIVDLLRNDLSIIATDVIVKRFRYIDKIYTNYGEILQVSSEITGKLPNNWQTSLGTIIFAMLPAGSVTGAPKTKTLEIIRMVEKIKRGYYTGICGIFDGENLDSAVMIRFIEINNNKMYFRSGGGITYQSNAPDEYNELVDKIYVPFNRKY